MCGILFKLSIVGVVVLAVFISKIPQPELSYEKKILPMARRFVELSASSEDEKPLEGRVVLITGATNGIGKGLAKTFVKLGAHVIAHGRSPSKLEALQQELESTVSGASMETVLADFSDLSQVSRMADELLSKESINRIDILINNAGIQQGFGYNVIFGNPKTDKLFQSAQGYDKTFATNYLSHFLLTEKLSGLLGNSSYPVIAQMSSTLHWLVDGTDLMSLYGGVQPPLAARPGGVIQWNGLPSPMRSMEAYSNSKLAQIYHARVLKEKHVILSRARIVSMCPGIVTTGMAGDAFGPVMVQLMKGLVFDPEGFGQASTLAAIFSSGGKHDDADFYTATSAFDQLMILISLVPAQSGLRQLGFMATTAGILFHNYFAGVKPTKSSPESYDMRIADSLYRWSQQAIRKYK